MCVWNSGHCGDWWIGTTSWRCCYLSCVLIEGRRIDYVPLRWAHMQEPAWQEAEDTGSQVEESTHWKVHCLLSMEEKDFKWRVRVWPWRSDPKWRNPGLTGQVEEGTMKRGVLETTQKMEWQMDWCWGTGKKALLTGKVLGGVNSHPSCSSPTVPFDFTMIYLLYHPPCYLKHSTSVSHAICELEMVIINYHKCSKKVLC